MLRQHPRVLLGAQVMQQLRRTLDIGEEEGDRAGREVGSHGAIIRPPGSRVQSHASSGDDALPCASVPDTPEVMPGASNRAGACRLAALRFTGHTSRIRVMGGVLYDWKAAAQLERAYATTDMIAQREELRRSLRASAGESTPRPRVSGPGFLACASALEVGATGRIVAVDISPDMNSIASVRIAAARSLATESASWRATRPRLRSQTRRSTPLSRCRSLSHLADPDAALHQLFRVVRPRRTTRDHRHRLGSSVRLGGRRIAAALPGSRRALERAPASTPTLRASARAPPPRGRIRGRCNPDRPDTQHGVRCHDLQPQHRPADRRRVRAPGARGVSEDDANEWLNDLAELQQQGRCFFRRQPIPLPRPRTDRAAARPLPLDHRRPDSLAWASVLFLQTSRGGRATLAAASRPQTLADTLATAERGPSREKQKIPASTASPTEGSGGRI